MLKNLPKTMKAVGLYKYLPLSDPQSLLNLDVPIPELNKNDVLIEVKATSVNPIDTKQRAPKDIVESTPRILGWDGAGVVVAKGEQVKLFKVGDEVFFTGDVRRSGSNAEYVAIEEILVGLKPKNLSYEEAAAMPLTTVTAYECIFDRLQLSKADKGKTMLIINSAGGVGSVASQILKNMGLKIIGTASREESKDWSLKHGVDVVLNHRKDLVSQLKEHGFDTVDYALVNYDPVPYWDVLMKVIKPQGKICLIVDASAPVDIKPLKDKSLTLVSEMMLTRIKYDTPDKGRHHEILKDASKLFEEGKLKSTLTKTLTPINADNIKLAHKLLEEQGMIGKIVASSFGINSHM